MRLVVAPESLGKVCGQHGGGTGGKGQHGGGAGGEREDCGDRRCRGDSMSSRDSLKPFVDGRYRLEVGMGNT